MGHWRWLRTPRETEMPGPSVKYLPVMILLPRLSHHGDAAMQTQDLGEDSRDVAHSAEQGVCVLRSVVLSTFSAQSVIRMYYVLLLK